MVYSIGLTLANKQPPLAQLSSITSQSKYVLSYTTIGAQPKRNSALEKIPHSACRAGRKFTLGKK